MIWREKRALLILLALVLAANTLFFFTYRVQYQSRLDALDDRLAAAENDLARATRERVGAEKTFQGYRQVEGDVRRVFDEHWSTQAARFTRMIAEVKRQTLASGMQPSSYGFQQTAAKLEKRSQRDNASLGITAVGVQFSVNGNYRQVRQLINLLELSRQFVIIDQVALVSRDGDQLTLTLHLTTLFRNEPAAATPDRL